MTAMSLSLSTASCKDGTCNTIIIVTSRQIYNGHNYACLGGFNVMCIYSFSVSQYDYNSARGCHGATIVLHDMHA